MWSPSGAGCQVRLGSSGARRAIPRPRYGEHRGRALALGAAAILVCFACHRTRASATPAPAVQWPPEKHCWWAAYRTTMPPDSVAGRFEGALASIGLSSGRTGSLGDTTWAQAGPTMLGDEQGSTFAARVVAIRMGDSTRFRAFVAADTIVGGRLIAMCGEIMSRAALRAIAPRAQEPDDSTPRWRRRL